MDVLPKSLLIMTATPADYHEASQLYRDRCEWLAFRRINQWPAAGIPIEILSTAIEQSELFLGVIGKEVVGAYRLSCTPDAEWLDEVERERDGSDTPVSQYLSLMVSARSWDGRAIGIGLIRDARERAQRAGSSRLRLVCPATSGRLVDYFGENGFSVRVSTTLPPDTTLFEQMLV